MSLRFPPELERAFREDYDRQAVFINRATFAGGILLVAGFGLVDMWAAPLSLRWVWLIRFGILTPLVGLLLLLSFTRVYPRILQAASALVGLAVGLGITTMVLLLKPAEIGHDLYIFGLAPVIIFLYTAPRLRFPYALFVGCAIALSSLAIIYGHNISLNSPDGAAFAVSQAIVWAVNLVGILAGYFIELGFRRSYLQERIIQSEQQRSDTLLRNILPDPVADRLKRGENVADYFSEVSVLFADIVDFTPFSALLSPSELIDFLNTTFSVFDRLVEKHKLEKIKTIGDCYMVVSGMPLQRPDHAEAIAEMALEMQTELRRMNEKPGSHPIQLRIGLNSGPVVAGVIGLDKFMYDLWGDTVNTASRMESHGLAGEIQVTERMYHILKDKYRFEERGVIQVKGKGTMRVFLLKDRVYCV